MRRALLYFAVSFLASSQQPEEGQTQRFTAGHQFVSAVTWSVKDAFLLIADRPAGQVRRIDAKGTTMWKEGLQAGGLAVDEKSAVYVSDVKGKRVIRIDQKGKQEVLASSFEGKRLNGPGDIEVLKNGHVWFADPAFGTADSQRELPFYGIYHISPKAEVTAIARLKSRPNGLALSHDGKTLYASMADDRTVLAFTIGKNGETTDQRVFAKGIEGVPAGLTTSPDGRVWLCARDIVVFSPEGQKAATIEMPEKPTDCEFGEDGKSLFIAAGTSVYRWSAKDGTAKEAAPHKQP